MNSIIKAKKQVALNNLNMTNAALNKETNAALNKDPK